MDYIEAKIFTSLKNQKQDITILTVAAHAGIDRHTAAKYLERMESKGLVEHRNIGKSKVWQLTNSPLLQAIKNNDPIAVELQEVLNSVNKTVIIRNQKEVVMDNAKSCHEGNECFEKYLGEKEKCEDCAVEKTLKTGKSNKTSTKNYTISTKAIKNKNKTVAVVEVIEKKK